jgi:hypothetical protein
MGYFHVAIDTGPHRATDPGSHDLAGTCWRPEEEASMTEIRRNISEAVQADIGLTRYGGGVQRPSS